MKFMRARFSSRCRMCGDPIQKGDPIIVTESGSQHETCDPEAAGQERVMDRGGTDPEYARGVADYERYRFNRDTFGEDYAASEELAWDLRDPDPAY